MSDPVSPNCIVTVHFFETGPSISFTCASCSSGWQVGFDGTIRSPSQGRIIQFSLKPFPSKALFAGFQFALDPGNFPPTSTPWPTLPPGVTSISPKPYPTGSDRVDGPLIFDFGEQTTPLVYRFGVAVPGGIPIWDDPRIYDDGSS